MNDTIELIHHSPIKANPSKDGDAKSRVYVSGRRIAVGEKLSANRTAGLPNHGATCFSEMGSPEGTFFQRGTKCRVEASFLPEISGVAASRKNDDDYDSTYDLNDNGRIDIS